MLELVAREFAKQESSQPFALFVSTIDTHFPRGYVNVVRAGAYLCADKLIAEFVEFAQNSPFDANTIIIICFATSSAQNLRWRSKTLAQSCGVALLSGCLGDGCEFVKTKFDFSKFGFFPRVL